VFGLHAVLEALAATYDKRYLDTDPLGIVRRYPRPEDRELVGLLAAALAYGNVKSIRAKLEWLLCRMGGESPSAFLDAWSAEHDWRLFEAFSHRFTRGSDIALLLSLVKQARRGAGTLEAFFCEGDVAPESTTLEAAMASYVERLFAQDARPFHASGNVPPNSGARYLLPSPSGGSVCKRHCLFLRWMVRHDDGVDCGVWKRVSPTRLVIPLDTHMQRMARALGLTRRKSSTWAMALEVTRALRAFDPTDPTRFDFALSRLGILGHLRTQKHALTRRTLAKVIEGVLQQTSETKPVAVARAGGPPYLP